MPGCSARPRRRRPAIRARALDSGPRRAQLGPTGGAPDDLATIAAAGAREGAARRIHLHDIRRQGARACGGDGADRAAEVGRIDLPPALGERRPIAVGRDNPTLVLEDAARAWPFHSDDRTRLQTTSAPSTSRRPAVASAGFVEKAPLERYVPPAKPSLVGLSRAQLGEALATIGVPPAQRKMRVQQIWHWLYVRGAARLRCDDQRVEGATCRARGAFHAGASRGRGRADLDRRHAQMAAAFARRACARAAARGRMRLHPGDRPRTLCLSSQVGCTLTCSFCHTGTQRLVRNLTPGEIVGQIMVARDRLGDWLGARAGAATPAPPPTMEKAASASSPTS